MANITNALLIVLSINALLWLGQLSAIQINPEADLFYNASDSIICDFETNNCADLYNPQTPDSNPEQVLPTIEEDITGTDTTSDFTDIFKGIKSFFTDTLGLKYVGAIYSAPSTFLKSIGLPPAVSGMLGLIWYGITILIVGAFLFGRDA